MLPLKSQHEHLILIPETRLSNKHTEIRQLDKKMNFLEQAKIIAVAIIEQLDHFAEQIKTCYLISFDSRQRTSRTLTESMSDYANLITQCIQQASHETNLHHKSDYLDEVKLVGLDERTTKLALSVFTSPSSVSNTPSSPNKYPTNSSFFSDSSSSVLKNTTRTQLPAVAKKNSMPPSQTNAKSVNNSIVLPTPPTTPQNYSERPNLLRSVSDTNKQAAQLTLERPLPTCKKVIANTIINQFDENFEILEDMVLETFDIYIVDLREFYVCVKQSEPVMKKLNVLFQIYWPKSKRIEETQKDKIKIGK